MLHEEESLPRITTSCSDLDNILGGGISCRDVTEIGNKPFSILFFLWFSLAITGDLLVFACFVQVEFRGLARLRLGKTSFHRFGLLTYWDLYSLC